MSAKNDGTINLDEGSNTDREIKVAIGHLIRNVRQNCRLSAEKVAKKLHMTRQNLTHIETGRHHVNAVTLWKLSCLFDCSPVKFIPETAKGYGFNNKDESKVKRVEPSAVEWAKELFGEKKDAF